jgi:RNA polymerase sigma-70 factor (ECF subfamily)
MRDLIRPHEPDEPLVSSVDEVFLEAEASQKRWEEFEYKEFRNWVEQTRDYVYSVCYRILLNETEAEDKTQETFIKAWLKREKYSLNPPSYLLKRIATNTCFDYLREQRRIKEDSIHAPVGEEIELIDILPSPQLGPDKLAELDELRQTFRKCWQSLKPDKRVLIQSVDWPLWEKWCHRVAEIRGVTYNGVKSKLIRAVRDLLACLRRNGFEPTHSELLDLLESTDDEEVM